MPIQGLLPEDILNLMRVPDVPGLFVLSPFEHPVNVMSQQVRATNLIYAIDKAAHALRRPQNGTPHEGLRMAVVGGGVAGCTAATYALLLGHHVTLLERESHLFHPLVGGLRDVDPTLYEWPNPSWRKSEASVPVLRWTASSASDLVKRLNNQVAAWNRLYDKSFVLKKNATVHIHPTPDRDGSLKLSWSPTGGGTAGEGQFDVVIVAVGFGAEREPPYKNLGFTPTPYWKEGFSWLDDWIERVLVIGNGDGAYADVIQSCLQNPLGPLGLRRILTQAVEDDSGLERRVREIEETARLQAPATISRVLTEQYAREDLCPALDAVLGPMLRDVTIVHAGRTDGILNPKTYPLNRLLVARIKHLLGKRYRYIAKSPDVWRGDERVVAAFTDSMTLQPNF